MPHIAIGPRVRKSPFYDATVDAGATAFTIYNQMYMPMSYGDLLAEYQTLTSGVSCWDVAAERQVEIVGPDAAALTQYVSARNLEGLRPGRARYAPMCDYDGCLINDPIALCLAEDRWWLSIADSAMALWVKAIAGAKGFDADVFEPDVSPLALQGPRADEVCRTLFGAELIDSIGFFQHRFVTFEGIPLVLCRSGWSRQGGFELFLTDGDRGDELWDRVMVAGEPHRIAPGAPNQMERIESGLLSYGSDTDADTDPIEAGLGQFVDLDTEHDFAGKDALIARRAEPHKRRRLVNVDIDGSMPPSQHPWPARLSGRPVGRVRSATWSPKLGRNIGLALVSTDAATPGAPLTVDADGEALTATVSPVPFGVSL